ncbi:hypothetical protein NP233_g409 [Leucocoprinus birnbaumii]|uniref:SET domain-containing protein n=1 Tax=Leucocoprinus birnbaumii TaxID=56174 RepID=A0AAD5W1V9_9AGAR|nr:hypothetical protein NP233_g409 [Leucocoprinus birnbaumii]
MPKPSRIGYTPTYPQFIVDFGDGEFSSCLRAAQAFKAGEYLVPLDASRLTKGPKAYTSVQCGPGPEDHIELNSDLVYVNHSCEPNIAFDLSSPNPDDWHLRALKRIEPGNSITFFYPSTEWDMDQPFTYSGILAELPGTH